MTSLLTHTASQMQAFPIGQMLMEIHLFGNEAKKLEPHTLGQFLDWWESMEERGVRPTWTEPNLLAVTVGLWDKMPRLAEVSPFHCEVRERCVVLMGVQYTFVNVNDPKSILW